jgi:hypothetical protein
MFAAPAEGTLKDFMEFAETGFADHEQSPPNVSSRDICEYGLIVQK